MLFVHFSPLLTIAVLSLLRTHGIATNAFILPVRKSSLKKVIAINFGLLMMLHFLAISIFPMFKPKPYRQKIPTLSIFKETTTKMPLQS